MSTAYTRPASYAAGQPLAQNRQAFATTSHRAIPGVNSAGMRTNNVNPGRWPGAPGSAIHTGQQQPSGMQLPLGMGRRVYQGGQQLTNNYGPLPSSARPGVTSLPNGGWFQPPQLLNHFNRQSPDPQLLAQGNLWQQLGRFTY